MAIVPSDYGNPEDFRGDDGMKAPLFTYVFVSTHIRFTLRTRYSHSTQVAVSLVLNTEEILGQLSCYGTHIRRLHPGLVLVFDLITCLGLFLSSYLVIFPTMFQFPLAKDLIWVSTALA